MKTYKIKFNEKLNFDGSLEDFFNIKTFDVLQIKNISPKYIINDSGIIQKYNKNIDNNKIILLIKENTVFFSMGKKTNKYITLTEFGIKNNKLNIIHTINNSIGLLISKILKKIFIVKYYADFTYNDKFTFYNFSPIFKYDDLDDEQMISKNSDYLNKYFEALPY